MPHYYLTVATRVDKLMALRSQINESLAASGEGKLSVNDFIVKASALVRALHDAHSLTFVVVLTRRARHLTIADQ